MMSPKPPPSPWLQAAREQWIWRGQARPAFACDLVCSIGGLPATSGHPSCPTVALQMAGFQSAEDEAALPK